MLSAMVDLGLVGALARNELGRLQASSKIENSVVTTGSNSRRSRTLRSKKLNPLKNLERHIWRGHPDV
jgi:hypothetical protein